MTDPIPFVDLAAQHAEVAADIEHAWAGILASSAYINGPAVREFEAAYADWIGVAHCIGVGNGTDALELALRACDVGPGDEVVLPANTFVATAEAVVRTGATPVFADCDDRYLLLDPASVAERLTPRTAAVIPVHLYGQMAPMAAIMSTLADGITVLEDAAQAHGAVQDGRKAGAIGDVAATSFYPGKNLGAYGDAGAVLTGRDDLAARLRLLRDHGSEVKYEHEIIGWNSRLDTLQAAVLHAKLSRLRDWNDARRAAAQRYDEMLADVADVRRPETAPGNEHVWHLYVVRVPNRDRVLDALAAAGIGTGVHYKVPVHLQPAFAHFGYRRGDFPVAEAAAEEILSLPMHPHLTVAQQERVVETLAQAIKDHA